MYVHSNWRSISQQLGRAGDGNQGQKTGNADKRRLFLHYNARTHRKDIVTRLLDDFKWEIVNHPAYSPDMALLTIMHYQVSRYLAGKGFVDEASLKAAVSSFFVKTDSAWYAQRFE